MPSRSLKFATDFLARRMLGFWPAIVASCSCAASSIFESCFDSPTPMFSVILSRRGACMEDEWPKRSISAGRISFRYLSFTRAMSVELRAGTLGDPHAGALIGPGRAHACGLLVLRVQDRDVGDVDPALALDHADLGVRASRVGALVALDDVEALDVDAAALAVDPQHLAGLALVLAGDDDHLVVAADLHHSTSGASDTMRMKPPSRSSRATGPKMRVPRGLRPSSMITAAFSSKAM